MAIMPMMARLRPWRLIFRHFAHQVTSNSGDWPFSFPVAKRKGQGDGEPTGPSNRAASWGFYSPEAFSVSGLRLSFVIFGFSVLQTM
jgi:hypothetical protein